MSGTVPSLAEAARRLRAALQRETDLARRGAVTELALAADAKQEAFAVFSDACQAWPTDAQRSDDDRGSLRALVLAASENTHILEAVRATLEGFTTRLRDALGTVADPGVYGPSGRRPYHVPAARFDASA